MSAASAWRGRTRPRRLRRRARGQVKRRHLHTPVVRARRLTLAPPHAPRPNVLSLCALDGVVCCSFYLDTFALRQWDDPSYHGSRITHGKADFVARVAEAHASGAAPLVDGYAPFCKHVFVPNFVGARAGSMAITEANRTKVRSGYEARTEYELAVLCRWFAEADVTVPEAKYLDVILYSREQIVLENKARDESFDDSALPEVPWGIISVKAQDEPFETPMEPITMMRNALGREEGGSGVKLDREKYRESVDYWRERAPIKR